MRIKTQNYIRVDTMLNSSYTAHNIRVNFFLICWVKTPVPEKKP